MEQWEREQAIWQRVSAAPSPTGRELGQTLREAMEQEAALQRLSGRIPGAKPLQALQQQTVAALRGMARLSGENAEDLTLWNAPGQSPRQLAHRCLHRSLAALTEYTARSGDPALGVLFRALARREEEMSLMLCQLMGTISL